MDPAYTLGVHTLYLLTRFVTSRFCREADQWENQSADFAILRVRRALHISSNVQENETLFNLRSKNPTYLTV